MADPLIVPLRQAPAGGIWVGLNAFSGSANIPTNVFVSHIVIRNENIHTGAPDTVTWTFPNCFIYLKRKPELEDELWYSGEISNTHQFVATAHADNIRYGGTRINISQPIPRDTVEPTIYISMEEIAGDVVYTPLVMEIHYTKYLHPVSHSNDFEKVRTASRGLRYAGVFTYQPAGITADAWAITTTDIPATEAWQVTMATLNLNGAFVWHLQKNDITDNYPLIRVAAAWTPTTYPNDIWLVRGEGLYLNEVTDGATCYYTISGVKWTIL